MIDFIYAVPLNATSSWPSRYRVIKETQKTYVLEYGAVVRKATMSNRWERFFADKHEAEEFIADLRDSIKNATKRIDVKYVHSELKALLDTPDFSEKQRLCTLARYVEEFL